MAGSKTTTSTSRSRKEKEPTCLFCNGSQDSVGAIFTPEKELKGICYCCVRHILDQFEAAPELVKEAARRNKVTVEKTLKRFEFVDPRSVFARLSQHIIGQDRAKRAASIAVAEHQKAILSRRLGLDVTLKKQNILFIGPTGCGKTELARQLAEILDVPFAIGDATTLTEAGYVGEDVENLILKLYHNAMGDIQKTQEGVIYIDEFDKIGKRTHNQSITRDVSGEGVQQSLLKLMEGTIANVPPQGGRKHPEQQYIRIDTTNILFICGGTFDGGGGSGRLEQIVAKRMKKRPIGFTTSPDDCQEWTDDELRTKVMPEDLVAFGMMPELIGRLPVVAPMNGLSAEDLGRVLVEPQNSLLTQYVHSFGLRNVNLTLDDDAIQSIAALAAERKVGARGLDSVMGNLLEDYQFNIADYEGKTIRITKEAVIGKERPIIEEQRKAA